MLGGGIVAIGTGRLEGVHVRFGSSAPLARAASRSALLLRADAVCKFGLGRDGQIPEVKCLLWQASLLKSGSDWG